MDKRVPNWAFSMGSVIVATQGLFIRLLLVSLSGNKLSIGLILGDWSSNASMATSTTMLVLSPRCSWQDWCWEVYWPPASDRLPGSHAERSLAQRP